MKNKYVIIIFIFGTILTIIGALFKITHWQIGIFTGNLIITLGSITQVIAGIIFIIKLLLNKKDDFLNQ
jgi:hypothetical protein